MSTPSTPSTPSAPEAGEIPVGRSGDDQTAITELVYRYAMAIDSLDGELLASCFLPEKDMTDMVQKTDEFHRRYAHTMHQVLNRRHVVDGDVATGKTYCVCTFVEDVGGEYERFDLYFEYADERFERRDGRWYIASRRIVPFFSTKRIPMNVGFPEGFWGELIEGPAPGSARVS